MNKMNLEVQKPKDDIKGYIEYAEDEQIVISNDKVYKLEYDLKNEEKVLYSLPHNDKHKPYSKRKRVKINKEAKDIVKREWTPFKLNDVVVGYINNNKFIVKR